MADAAPQATAQEEVAGLDKVLSRLALTEDANLQQVLHRLIPAVLRLLKSPHDATRKKVMEVMGHVNKRLKGVPTMPLPLADLVHMACDPASNAMVRSFALVYAEIAFERATPQERLAAVPQLMSGVSARPQAQRTLVMRLVLQGLEALKEPISSARGSNLPPAVASLLTSTTTTTSAPASTGAAAGPEAPSKPQDPASSAMQVDPPPAPGAGDGAAAFSVPAGLLQQYPFLANDGDRRVLLEVATHLLLFVPQASGPKISTPLQAAQAQAGGGGAGGVAGAASTVREPPPGMSTQDVASLADKAGTLPAGEVLTRRKLGVLHFLAGGVASPSELLIPLLVASCDPVDAVSRRGEELSKRLCATEGPKPAVDLDRDPQGVLTHLFALFHGTAGLAGSKLPGLPDAATLPPDAHKQPASAAVRCRVLALLCRSVAAASVFPATILTIQEAVYGTTSAVFTSARLRAQGMEFAVWVARHCPTHQLKAMAPAVLQGLLRTLHMSGEGEEAGAAALSQDHQAITLRGFAYQAVGQLANRVPQVMAGRVDIARAFFAALAEEPPGLRATVAEATASLSAAFKEAPPGGWPDLDAMLLDSVNSSRDAVRLCAVQWANRIYPLHHVPVREEAARGLRLNPQSLQRHPAAPGASPGGACASPEQLPALTDLLAYATKQVPQLRGVADPNRPLPLKPRSYLALMRFSEACWAAGLSRPPPGSSPPSGVEVPEAYLVLLEGALTRQATGELLASALQELMHVAQEAPRVVEERASARLPVLLPLLAHVDPAARLGAARLVGIAAATLTHEACDQLLLDLSRSFGLSGQPQAPEPGGAAPPDASSSLAAGAAGDAAPGGPAKFEQQEGSIMAAGFVLAQRLSMPVDGAAPPSSVDAQVAASLLHAAQAHAQALLAAAAVQALAFVGVAVGAQALAWLLQSHPSSSTAPAPSTSAPSTSTSTPAPAPSPPAPRKEDLSPALGAPLASLYQRASDLTTDRDAKVASRAISAAGLLAWSWGVQPSRAALPEPQAAAAEQAALAWLQHCLLGLSTSKAEEVQFTAGEAVALLFGGVPLAPSVALRTHFGGLAGALPGASPTSTSSVTTSSSSTTPSGSAPQPMEVEAPQWQQWWRPDSAARGQVQAALLTQLLDMAIHSKVEVRCASAVWLVSLLTFSGQHPALRARLAELQDALSGLLGDPHELTQEMASRGVSIIYELGDAGQRQTLVQALVGVLQGAGPKAAKVKLQADTKVFEEGSVGQVPGGGSLSTYQELCSLATELGQPDLVYKFMDLAHHQQALNTRRGAAFGFASVAKLAGDALAPHVQQLVPKLYRYQYDPNPRVQDAMSSIWKALVSDPKGALDAAFPALMADLLKELGGRLWRNRQASCGALADLIQGRRWSELRPHLAQLWTMSFRALDDIKDSVRKAAEVLVRSVRGVTLRLCDAGLTTPSEAREATAVVLPLMLEQGLLSSVKEVQAVSLDVVAKVARAAGAEALKPLLPQTVQALLEGLSSLEDARLNYLEQHANRLGIDSERLDTARSSAARASPLGDTLELAARVAGGDAGEGGSLAALLPVLTGILARGVGLNTKMGTARFIRGVALRAASDLRPHAPALLKALMSAVRKERSAAVRKAYAGAAAQVCKFAASKRVEKVVGEAVEWYLAEGADADTRQCGGLVLRELLRVAPEAFNEHAARILPVAFQGKMDEDASVAAAWLEVWEEGCSSEAGALRLYSQEITGILADGLASQQWSRKKACAAAIKAVAELGGEVLPAPAVARLSGALLSELPGRLWDGKEGLLAALGALAKAYPGAVGGDAGGGSGGQPDGHRRVLEAVMAAAQRKKHAFRAAALACLHACLTSFTGDYFTWVAPALVEAVQRHLAAPTQEADKEASPAAPVGGGPAAAPGAAEGAEGEEAAKPWPLVDSLNCLAATLAHFQGREQQQQQQPLVAAVVQAVGAVARGPLPWASRLAAVHAARALADRVEALRKEAAGAPEQTQASPAVAALQPQVAELLSPVAVCLEEVQVQQVRTAALACLGALVGAAGCAPTDLAPEAVARVLAALGAVVAGDKAAASSVLAAQRLKALLTGGVQQGPAPMELA